MKKIISLIAAATLFTVTASFAFATNDDTATMENEVRSESNISLIEGFPCSENAISMLDTMDLLAFTSKEEASVCLSDGKYLLHSIGSEEIDSYNVEIVDSVRNVELKLSAGGYIISREESIEGQADDNDDADTGDDDVNCTHNDEGVETCTQWGGDAVQSNNNQDPEVVISITDDGIKVDERDISINVDNGNTVSNISSNKQHQEQSSSITIPGLPSIVK